MYDVTRGLRQGGQFLLNTIFEGEELVHFMPNSVKKYFAEKNITVYYINATKIAQEIGLGNRTNTILQSAFFRITGVIPVELAVEQMKKAIVKSYGKKGEDVVNMNFAAVDRGGEYKTLAVDPAWKNLPDDEAVAREDVLFLRRVEEVRHTDREHDHHRDRGVGQALEELLAETEKQERDDREHY
jgi:pyruvate-ferredoxin/flavodoxin oxidoreductase